MERLHDMFDHPHKLVIHRGWNHVLHHKVANGLCGITETERELCWGTLDEVFKGEWLFPSKLCHDIGEQEGEVAQALLGRLGS